MIFNTFQSGQKKIHTFIETYFRELTINKIIDQVQ